MFPLCQYYWGELPCYSTPSTTGAYTVALTLADPAHLLTQIGTGYARQWWFWVIADNHLLLLLLPGLVTLSCCQRS